MNRDNLKTLLSTFIMTARLDQNLTHTSLAKKARLARSTIHNIENGNTSPTLENTIMVLTALGLDLADLSAFISKKAQTHENASGKRNDDKV